MDTPPRLRFLLGCLLCLPMALVFYLVGSAGHDDSHITYWQAWTLNHQGALLNYNGERLEQSSSLLQVLLAALLAQLAGISEASSGWLVNCLAGISAIMLCYRIAEHNKLALPWLPALLTSSSIYFSYWAFSGMEATLAALCVLLFVQQCHDVLASQANRDTWRMLTAMLTCVMLATVRPEMMFVGPAWLLCMGLFYPKQRRTITLLLIPFLGVLAWRYLYFGQWFPNPVYAKTRGLVLGQLLEQWQSGFDYLMRVTRHPSSLGLAILFSGCCALGWKETRTHWQHKNLYPMLPWLLWVTLYAGFVIGSGGDWMKDGRFWVPLIAPASLVVSDWIAKLPTRGQIPVICCTLLLQLFHANDFITRFNFGMSWSQQARWESVFPYASFIERSNREPLRDLPAIAELEQWLPRLYRQEQRPITLMSKQMGLVNYTLGTQFTGTFRVMDMAGLVENSLRNCDVMTQDGFEKQGMRLNYRKFFDRLPLARSRCQINAPDIIYDIYGWGETQPLPDYLQTQGYHIVFNQTGRINMKPGSDVTAHELIAIKKTLLGTDVTGTEKVDFNRLAPQ